MDFARFSDSINVLYVDDEPDMGNLVVAFLERQNDDVTVAYERYPAEALERIEVESFDCIISDHDMPKIDGLELLQRVRVEYPDLPFILFTGKGSEEVASEAISAGVTDYVQKRPGQDQYRILGNRVRNSVGKYWAQLDRQRAVDAIEMSHEGFSFLDDTGHFIYLNRAYADIFGYDRDELLGEHWEILYPEGGIDHVREEMLPAAKEGHWSGKTTFLRKDRTRIETYHALTYSDNSTLVCLVLDPPGAESKPELTAEQRAFIEISENTPIGDVKYCAGSGEDAGSRSPTVAVVDALADTEGIDLTALDYVLHDYLDPDALDRLLLEGDSDVTVQFDINDHTIIVGSGGLLTVDGTQYYWDHD